MYYFWTGDEKKNKNKLEKTEKCDTFLKYSEITKTKIERTIMGNLRKKRRRKIAQHKRKKLLKALRHKNK